MTTNCPTCSAPLRPGASVCAACAFGEAAYDGPALAEIGGHEVIEEIARGGMGVVYRAKQREPEREVALKTLLGAGMSSPSARERFRLEARAMADLRHPGIVPVHQFGEHDGVPFFTMPLLRGGSLAERRASFAGKWRELAGLVAGIADAVQFAHERGVLHRDLKPGNILFDDGDRACVSDFGLAKLTAMESQLTRSIATLGTPAYLAPEVAVKDARAATIASDVWALGAMLYELLAQHPPFEAESIPALMRRIVEEEPAALSGPPRDLGVIALKALAKSPAQRYATARELAEDLRRWLEGRTILARSATQIERLTSWARRNRGLAASLAGLAALIVAFAATQWSAKRNLAASLAETRLREVRLIRASGKACQRFAALETLSELASQLPNSRRAELRTEAAAALALPDLRPLRRWSVPVLNNTGVEEFSADLSRYAAARAGGGLALYDAALQKAIREWPEVDASHAQDFLFDPRSAWLGVRFADTRWQLLPIADGAPLRFVSQPAFHPEGIATVRDGALTLDGPAPRTLLPATLYAEPLMLDGNGERALVFKGEPTRAFIAQLSDGATLATIANPPHRVTASDWSRDGRLIALADGEPPFSVRVYDAATGAERAVFTDHQMPVRKLTFHANSESLATAGDDQLLVWREIEPGGFRLELEAGERALRFGTDGGRLGYSPGDGELGILEAALPAAFRAWPSPARDRSGAAYSADLSSDGRWLAVMHDKSLRIWDTAARRETAREPFTTDRVWWGTVFFSPKENRSLVWSPLGGGTWRASIGDDGTLREKRDLGGAKDAMIQQFAADGRSLIIGERRSEESTAWLWPEADPARASQLAGGGRFNGFRLLPGTEFGISTHFSDPDLWLWSGGKKLRSLGIGEPTASEPSADGRWLLTGTRSESILWDVKTWTAAARWPARPGERDAWAPAFSPDSRILAQAAPTGHVTLRAVPSGEEILTLAPPRPVRVQKLLFTPGGLLLLVGGDGRVFEWNLTTVREELGKMNLGW